MLENIPGLLAQDRNSLSKPVVDQAKHRGWPSAIVKTLAKGILFVVGCLLQVVFLTISVSVCQFLFQDQLTWLVMFFKFLVEGAKP